MVVPPERHCVLRYAKPRTVDEALALLAEDRWRILAGGTDFYPAQGARPITDNMLDINGLDALRGVSETDAHHVIGARTTWSEIARHGFPPAFDSLRQAAMEVGSIQIQNTGTVAGNLCNASPAADGAPPLMTLDAEVELAALGALRYLPLSTFIRGNRRTALAAGEMLTAIRIPKASAGGASAFFKLGARRYLVISIAMAAARVRLGTDGTIAEAAVAVGSCSAVAQRLAALEVALTGMSPEADAIRTAIVSAGTPELAPIDDVRGTAAYRSEAAGEIVCRALLAATGTAARERAAA